VSHYSDVDALPRYQNIAAAFDMLTTLSAKPDYSYLRRSPGAIDDEKGFSQGLKSIPDDDEFRMSLKIL